MRNISEDQLGDRPLVAPLSPFAAVSQSSFIEAALNEFLADADIINKTETDGNGLTTSVSISKPKVLLLSFISLK